MGEVTQADIQTFIERWQASGAAERANYQLFLTELCAILGVDHPQPASENPHENAYVFEKTVPSGRGTTNFIDLYKRGHFVLEAKQGSDKQSNGQTAFSEAELKRRQRRKKGTAVRGTKSWDTAMEKARQQAQTYARSLPTEEIKDGRPPFILVVDVGNTIALHSEFSRTGGNYIPFPDPSSYRLKLDDLHDANVRQLLRQVWDDPMSLDPSRRSARVTREIAARLAELAKSLEGSSNAEAVAQFLMRCLFTMFAEDVGLLPERSFTQLLDDIRNDPDSFKPMLEHLWDTMNKGGFSVILRRQIPKFNGGLFSDQTALSLTLPQIELLVEAAKADWRDVEPAIFGTLLERALDPVERHKLGAHYTPRAYVERLVKPTIIEPLRAEWESVQAAALLQAESDQLKKAIAEVETFHRRLATIRILDPACGSGNFLYVTLEHLKRLEGEVLNTLQELGQGQMRLEMESITVSPQQFLGIEVNPRAAAIAELVLWIGYLQWHYRTRGNTPHSEPIIRDFHNIECRDAVLAWDAVEPLLDENGQPVTRWDGRTTKPHPVTGEQVPDETARMPAYNYINPHMVEWPETDYIIGNPPFLGKGQKMRDALGDGYIEAIRNVYPEVPASTDFVMYWWQKAAQVLRVGNIQRFGFIATSSISQTFNRKVIEQNIIKKPNISLAYVIPNHPWIDSSDGADVRISVTVAEIGEQKEGVLQRVVSEMYAHGEIKVVMSFQKGWILPDLTIGPNLTKTIPLKANESISSMGLEPGGSGFTLTEGEARQIGLGSIESLDSYIRPYINGRDLTQNSRNVYVIDLYGLELQVVQERFPEVYQHLQVTVKPKRAENRNHRLREYWWLHRRSRKEMRDAMNSLSRYIVTVYTSKHRLFTFVDIQTLPDMTLVVILSDDPYILGVLSGRKHTIWSLAAGGRLGVGNDPRYNKTKCFEPFPFPDASETQKARIRELAKKLDAHRKRQQAQHPKLTLTNMYNVLEKVRAEYPLTAKEKTIYEQGLISILKQLHDDLDKAIFDAYGWPSTLTNEEILQHLVDLNTKRVAEEANGLVRWLRPEYQAPDEVQHKQATLLDVTSKSEAPVALVEKQNWPKALKDRATAVRAVLAAFDDPVGVKEVASGFNGKRTQKRLGEVEEILEMLVTLGQIEEESGKFTDS